MLMRFILVLLAVIPLSLNAETNFTLESGYCRTIEFMNYYGPGIHSTDYIPSNGAGYFIDLTARQFESAWYGIGTKFSFMGLSAYDRGWDQWTKTWFVNILAGLPMMFRSQTGYIEIGIYAGYGFADVSTDSGTKHVTGSILIADANLNAGFDINSVLSIILKAGYVWAYINQFHDMDRREVPGMDLSNMKFGAGVNYRL